MIHSILRVVLAGTVLLFCGGICTAAEEAHWLNNFQQALDQAKAGNKDILLDFTGSDWCEACLRMEKDVFTKEPFKTYAGKNLILMRVDFPQGKQLPLKEQQQNADLAERYGAGDAVPTFLLLNKKGDVIWREVGYLDGGPSVFIGELEKAKK